MLQEKMHASVFEDRKRTKSLRRQGLSRTKRIILCVEIADEALELRLSDDGAIVMIDVTFTIF